MGLSNEATEKLVESFFEVDALDTDSFLKVKETLTRIGLPGKRTDGRPVLWQTAHVLQKRGHYFICHFKQLFQLDGRTETEFTDEDEDRLEFIVCLLEEWGLVKSVFEIQKPRVNVMIIPHSDKHAWDLKSKYTLGADKVRFKQANKWSGNGQEK
jgi:hypothetical protein